MSARPLVIEGLGVRLTRLKHEDIQLVREWRNSANVATHMHYQQTISAEQQERWFASLDPNYDFYFIIEFEGEKVGLSSLKHIDPERKTGEGGLFLVPQALRNGLVPYRASLPALDWIYRDLGLESVTASVRRENRRAIRFNASLGHQIDESRSDLQSISTVQTRETWISARPKFLEIFGEWYVRDTRWSRST